MSLKTLTIDFDLYDNELETARNDARREVEIEIDKILQTFYQISLVDLRAKYDQYEHQKNLLNLRKAIDRGDL